MDHFIVRPVAAELHQQLPWWVGYASLLSTVLVASLASLIFGLTGAAVAGLPMLNAQGKSWYERARRAYSLRVVLLLQMLVWPMVTFVVCSFWPLPLAFGSLAVRCFPPAIASLLVLALLRFAGERRILQNRFSIWQLMKNTIVYHFALGHVLLFVAVIAMVAMPWEFNLRTLAIAGGTLLAIVFFSCGGSLLVLRGLGLLIPADARLNNIVADVARQLETPTPVTYIARIPSANALAFPWNGKLAFTEGILQSLSDEQLGSVAAHEICHLGMPTSQKFTRLTHAMLLLVPLTLIKPVWGQFGTAAILPSLIGFLLIVFILQIFGRRLMQREEERADRAGAEANEAVYARALEQIYRENLIPVSIKSPQGHPPLYDRMVSSGVTPDYEKPPTPPAWIRHAAMLAQLAVFFAFVLVLVIVFAVVQVAMPETTDARLAQLAIIGGPMRNVSVLGETYIGDGEEAIGLALLEYAKDEAPHDVEVLARLARVYAVTHRCDEARDLIKQAETSLGKTFSRRRGAEALSAAQEALLGCE